MGQQTHSYVKKLDLELTSWEFLALQTALGCQIDDLERRRTIFKDGVESAPHLATALEDCEDRIERLQSVLAKIGA